MAPEIVIYRRSYQLLIVLVAILLAGTLIFAASRRWLAVHWAEQDNPQDWTRATRLEPEDAQIWWRIALHYERDPVYRSLPKAATCLERAIHFDSHSGLYWAELGKVEEELGEVQKAHFDYEQAEAASPVSARVAWQYGGFLLRQGQIEQATERVHRAIADKPDLTASAVAEFWKSGAGIAVIVDRLLPPNVDSYRRAIDFFVGQQQDEAALACWNRLSEHHWKIRLRQALPLIDSLIDHNRIADAQQVWLQAVTASGHSTELGTDGSLIFDGGFQQPVVNGGFGWRQVPVSGSAFDLVTDVTHKSSQAARVVFDGSRNVDYANLLQYVAVEPGRHYRFSAYMRTDEISTDRGPQFLLSDCTNPGSTIAETPAMTGTHPWTKVEAEFTTGPQTDCVRVVLRRRTSELFSNRIQGAVWVDDVRLVKLSSNDTSRGNRLRRAPTAHTFAGVRRNPGV